MCPLAHIHGTCPCIEDLLLKVGDFQKHTSNYQMRGIRDVKYDENWHVLNKAPAAGTQNRCQDSAGDIWSRTFEVGLVRGRLHHTEPLCSWKSTCDLSAPRCNSKEDRIQQPPTREDAGSLVAVSSSKDKVLILARLQSQKCPPDFPEVAGE